MPGEPSESGTARYLGKTTAYDNNGQLCAFVSRHTLRRSDVEDGDSIEWRWEDGQIVGQVVADE